MKNSILKTAVLSLLLMVSEVSFAGNLACRQVYRPALTEIQYLMNTKDLVSFVERGNAPRQGIDKIWSSRAVLQELLSLRGPLGPLGPVGELGPIGDNTWNPSFWWTQFVRSNVWRLSAGKLSTKAGPLSKYGSLSDIGPLAKDWGEGAYSILGTRGILGPLGPLGALGLMGALQTVGLKGPDENGNYRYKGRIIKSVNIEWTDGVREFEIMEKYTSKEAQRRSRDGSLENSYMVDASMSAFESKQSYKSKSDREKLVSVLVVPDAGAMVNMFGMPLPTNFSIEVRDKSGNLIGISDMSLQANFVQFAVPKNGEYEVIIKRQGFSALPLGYRLISVGAGAELFEMFPHIIDANTAINLHAQIEDYLKELKDKHFKER
tara:strand:+ start:1806 stop:2936 length:1131 start_codon:yes stop_codon:yes gene_type:complete